MNSEDAFDKRINSLISSVKNTEAELKDPASLTEDILSVLPDKNGEENSMRSGVGRSTLQHVMFRRLIAAAAILLFSVFTYEQFIILDKLNRLEESRQNPPEQGGWELRTVMKYRTVKENHKTFFDIVETLGKENGSKPGILKRYFQQKTQIKIKKQNNMGIH